MSETSPASDENIAVSVANQAEIDGVHDHKNVPPSVELAQSHYLQSRPLQPHAEMSTWDTPVEKFGAAGLGAGQYFKWLRNMMIMFFVCTVLSIYMLIEAGSGDETGMDAPAASFTSIGNIHKRKVSFAYGLMDVLMAVTLMGGMWYIRKDLDQYEQTLDVNTVSTQDFAVKVSGLPVENITNKKETEAEIKKVFEKFGQVVNVVLSLNNGDQIVTARKSQALTLDVQNLKRRLHIYQDDALKGPLAEKEKELEANELKLRELEKPTYQSTGYAYVTFNEMHHCTACFEADSVVFRNNITLQTSRATAPSNIAWEFLSYTPQDRIGRVCLSFLFAGAIIFADVMFLVWINLLANPDGEPGQVSFGMVLLTTLGIIIGNVSMFAILPLFALKFEKHHTFTHMEISSLCKLIFFQTMNTFAVAYFVWGTPKGNPDFYNNGGNFVLNLLAGDLLLLNGIEMIRPEWLAATKLLGPKAASQLELNKLYEGVPLMLWQRYQFVFKFICISLFFGAALPLLYFILWCCCCMTYYVDRYNMIYKFKKPPNFSSLLTWFVMVILLPISLGLKFTGSLYWFYGTDSWSTYWVTAVLCGLYILVWLPLYLGPWLWKKPKVADDIVNAKFLESPEIEWFLDPLDDLNLDFHNDATDKELQSMLTDDGTSQDDVKNIPVIEDKLTIHPAPADQTTSAETELLRNNDDDLTADQKDPQQTEPMAG